MSEEFEAYVVTLRVVVDPGPHEHDVPLTVLRDALPTLLGVMADSGVYPVRVERA